MKGMFNIVSRENIAERDYRFLRNIRDAGLETNRCYQVTKFHRLETISH